jgi:hypothetical protein
VLAREKSKRRKNRLGLIFVNIGFLGLSCPLDSSFVNNSRGSGLGVQPTSLSTSFELASKEAAGPSK